MLGGLLLVAQFAITANAPPTVGACAPLTITVDLRAPGTQAPAVSLPDFRPFALVQSSARPRLETDSRRGVWVTDQYRYVVSTARPGTYVIPSFVARLGSQTIRSQPLRVTVVPPELSDGPAIVTRAAIDHDRAVHFRALALPDTVYVGEQVTYQAAAFLEDSVQGRLRRNPEFFPPEMRAMLAYDLPFVRGYLPRRARSNRCYEVPVFQRAIFPLMPGRHVIPPAQLVYTLPRSHSFFSREESHELRTDSVTVVAVEPPVADRPADFTGAVGSFTVSARVDTTESRVGVPLVLTVRVEGTGNVKLLPRPALAIPWGGVVPSGERVEVTGETTIVGGAKEFDWVLTPHQPGALTVPSVRYAHFDPRRDAYVEARSAPVPLAIAQGAIAALDTAAAAVPPMPIRREFRGALPEPLHTRAPFWVVLLVAPLPAITLAMMRRPKRPVRIRTASQRLGALVRSPEGTDPRTVRRAFVAALSERLALSALVTTRRGALVRAMRRRGVSASVAAEAVALLVALDEAAFGARRGRVPDAARRACRVYETIDREALRRPRATPSRRQTGAGLIVLVALLGGATALEARRADDAAERSFARGVSLYGAGAWPSAARAFGTAARLVPRGADAWANYGTAAWAAGDTVDAMIGWQRALRLEPLATDARERLALLNAAMPGELDAVPPIPASPLALAAGLFWVVASILAFLAIRNAAPGTRALARFAGVMAIALGGAAWHVERRTAGDDLVVATNVVPLRAVPALGGESLSAVAGGEVMERLETRGPWVRVRTADLREGWLEMERLVPLARD